MKNTFHLVTIFPNIFESYLAESILKRAKQSQLIGLKVYDLRDWTTDKHRKVDDTPYGGGAGMVMKVEPIARCVTALTSRIKRAKKSRVRIVLFSAKGKRYTQQDAVRLSKYEDIILLCGRYEGVDERVARYIADEEISLGDFVLTGGEIPALAVVDSVSRLVPGVLKNSASLEQESHSQENYLEYPQYTKPEVYKKWRVPKVLLSGNHGRILEWRRKNSDPPDLG